MCYNQTLTPQSMHPSINFNPRATVFSTINNFCLRGLRKTGIFLDGDLLSLFQVLRSFVGIVFFSLSLSVVLVLLTNPEFLDFL
jgi:hypothetical protein